MQRLHVSIYLAYSILLNFLIYFQLTAKIGGIAIVRACPETGGINASVGIALKEGIRALSSRPLSSRPLSSRPSSNIYSGEVCE